ncbi:MAG TPA: hypothetical protein VHN37_10550 [Actinomycetota bacterium]|nr:hypothetical protein [Actinomycetota bacterium]
MRRWVVGIVLSSAFGGLWGPQATALQPQGEIAQDRIEYGELPSVAVAAAGRMWVLDRWGEAIAEIDPATNEVVGEIDLAELGLRSAWDLVTVRGSLWISAGRHRYVELDPATGEIASDVRRRRSSSELQAARGSLWLTESTRRKVWLVRMDPRSGKTVARFRLGRTNTHAGKVVAFDGSIWALREHGRHVAGTGPSPTFYVTASLWRIDPRSNEIVDKMPLGSTYTRGPVNPVIGDIAVADGGLWMSRVHERRLVLVNPRTGRVRDVQPVAEFRLPWEIEVLGEDVWVGELNETRIARVEPATDGRTFVDVDAPTSYIAAGFGSVWAPVASGPEPRGEVVRLTPR